MLSARCRMLTSPQVAIRLSRRNDPGVASKPWSHFEITISSPFTLLNCRAALEEGFLPPQYNSLQRTIPSYYENLGGWCGCIDADDALIDGNELRPCPKLDLSIFQQQSSPLPDLPASEGVSPPLDPGSHRPARPTGPAQSKPASPPPSYNPHLYGEAEDYFAHHEG